MFAIVASAYGAWHSYQSRNAFIQAALLSEAFSLSLPVRERVADYLHTHGSPPQDNSSAGLPAARTLYGTSVKRVAVQAGGRVSVEFDGADAGGASRSLQFTPVATADGRLDWQCHSNSIETSVLSRLRPRCTRVAPEAGDIGTLRGTVARPVAALTSGADDRVREREILEGLYLELSVAARRCHVQRLSSLLRSENALVDDERIDGRPLASHIDAPACRDRLAGFLAGKPVFQRALQARLGGRLRACDTREVEQLLHEHPALTVLDAPADGVAADGSPFQVALSAGCPDLVDLLIRERALQGRLDGALLVHAIAHTPQQALVRVIGSLLATGVDVNQAAPSGMTALEAAIAFEQPVVAKYIVDAGADIDAITVGGSYPIIEATKKGYSYLVPRMIARGADVDRRDAYGRTALLVAVAHAHQRLVDVLLRAGADLRKRDANGVDALVLAQSRDQRQITRLLQPLSVD